jgi:succinoglycan biosynthesis protein ExoM
LGARYIWCNEAPVYELVSAERTSLAWILRRSFAGGKTFVRVCAETWGGGAYLVLALRGVVGALVFSALAVVAVPISRSIALKLARRASGDAGKVVAAIAEKQGNYGG